MKARLSLWLFAVLILGSCDRQDLNSGKGALKGKISIGPLCPVETDPPLPQCLPTADTYRAWQTSVWTLTRKKVADLNPDLAGNYILGIGTGNYIIDFAETRTGGVGSSNLPALIHIADKDTTRFNINIDTGIR